MTHVPLDYVWVVPCLAGVGVWGRGRLLSPFPQRHDWELKIAGRKRAPDQARREHWAVSARCDSWFSRIAAGISGARRPLPHRQSHVIDPFVKWSTGGILVQLELDADHIRPSGIVDVPGLIDSVGFTIYDQGVVAILGGIDALLVH
jgi:hypothetical protein